MSSGRAGEKLSGTGAFDPSVKGKIVVEGSSPGPGQSCQGVAGVSLDAGQEEGRELYSRKSKNKAGNGGGKRVPKNSASKARGNAVTVQKLGMWSNAGSGKGPGKNWGKKPTEPKRADGRANRKPQSLIRGYDNNNAAPTPAIGLPLRNGWGWSTRATSAESSDGLGRENNVASVNPENVEDVKVDDDDNDSDVLDDSDDELLSDGFDSDASKKSHETYKKDRWFKELFECLDSLTVEQITEPERQWHCPACKGGPGAIDWYNGLEPLIMHAKTKGSKRMKLHRKLAELLEEELRRRRTSVIPAGEVFGSWKGMDERVEKEIVWPPMVIIMNTILEKDENDKYSELERESQRFDMQMYREFGRGIRYAVPREWIGMGNHELLDCFSFYVAVKAQHSYGPEGHRGMSVLIFEASAIGYLEAKCLSKHFKDDGRGRTAWDSPHVAFGPGRKRQLFGYMAEKTDLDKFNQHSHSNMKLKFEMHSYQEMVVKQLKQMSEDNQQLILYKIQVAKEQKHSKALEEAYSILSEKYRRMLEENQILRERIKMNQEQNKKEMDSLEQFVKEGLKMMLKIIKEENFEKIQQEENGEAVSRQSFFDRGS